MDNLGDKISITYFHDPHNFCFTKYDDGVVKRNQLENKIEKLILTKTLKHCTNVARFDYRAMKYLKFNRYIRIQVLELYNQNKKNKENCIVWAIDYGFPIITSIKFLWDLPDELCCSLDLISWAGITEIFPAILDYDFLNQEKQLVKVNEWNQRLCERLEKSLNAAAAIFFKEKFNIKGHRWGELIVSNNSGKYSIISKCLLDSNEAIKDLKSFRNEIQKETYTNLYNFILNSKKQIKENDVRDIFRDNEHNLFNNATDSYHSNNLLESEKWESQTENPPVFDLKPLSSNNPKANTYNESEKNQFSKPKEKIDPKSLPKARSINFEYAELSDDSVYSLNKDLPFGAIPDSDTVSNASGMSRTSLSESLIERSLENFRLSQAKSKKLHNNKNQSPKEQSGARPYESPEEFDDQKSQLKNKERMPPLQIAKHHEQIEYLRPKYFPARNGNHQSEAPRQKSDENGPSNRIDFLKEHSKNNNNCKPAGIDIELCTHEDYDYMFDSEFMSCRRGYRENASRKNIDSTTTKNPNDAIQNLCSTKPPLDENKRNRNFPETNQNIYDEDLINWNRSSIDNNTINSEKISFQSKQENQPKASSCTYPNQINEERNLNNFKRNEDYPKNHKDMGLSASRLFQNNPIFEQNSERKRNSTNKSDLNGQQLQNEDSEFPIENELDKFFYSTLFNKSPSSKDGTNDFDITEKKHESEYDDDALEGLSKTMNYLNAFSSFDSAAYKEISEHQKSKKDTKSKIVYNQQTTSDKTTSSTSDKTTSSRKCSNDAIPSQSCKNKSISDGEETLIEVNPTKGTHTNFMGLKSSTKAESDDDRRKAIIQRATELLDIYKVEELIDVKGEIEYNASDTTNWAMVHSKAPSFPLKRYEEAIFHTEIQKVMNSASFYRIYRTQAYAWPHLQRNNSLFLINSKNSGKTWSYLPVLCSLVAYRLYNNNNQMDRSYGPIAIILVPSGSHAINISEMCSYLMRYWINENISPVVALYGRRNDTNVKLQLLNSCGILITTPASMNRILKFNENESLIDSKRLKHLVIDDIDVMLDSSKNFTETCIKSILNMTMKTDKTKTLLQIICTSKDWNPWYIPIIKKTSGPMLLIGNFLEAAVYSKCSLSLKFNTKVEKPNEINKFLKNTSKYGKIRERTIIFCNTNDEVLEVKRILNSSGYESIIYTNESSESMRYLIENWKEKNCGEILVCSDDFFPNLQIQNATFIIHYSLSTTWTRFTMRFYAANKIFTNYLKTNFEEIPDHEQNRVTSLILLDEDNSLELPRLIQFMKKHNQTVHPDIEKVVKTILYKNEMTRIKSQAALCSEYLEFGDCTQLRCNERHSLSVCDRLDEKDGVPYSGEVRIAILKIMSPTHVVARLIEHKAENSTQWQTIMRSNEFKMFFTSLNLYYSDPQNTTLHWPPKIGDICIYKIDDYYRRCKIIEIINKSTVFNIIDDRLTVKIYLIDIGQELKIVKANELLQIADKFRDYPFQAINIRLLGVIPYDNERTWDYDATKAVETWLKVDQKKFINIRIKLAIKRNIWAQNIYVEEYLESIKTIVRKVNLKATLIEKSFALANPQESLIIKTAQELGVFDYENHRSKDEIKKKVNLLEESLNEDEILPKSQSNLIPSNKPNEDETTSMKSNRMDMISSEVQSAQSNLDETGDKNGNDSCLIQFSSDSEDCNRDRPNKSMNLITFSPNTSSIGNISEDWDLQENDPENECFIPLKESYEEFLQMKNNSLKISDAKPLSVNHKDSCSSSEKSKSEESKPNEYLSNLKSNESIQIEDNRNPDYKVKESCNALAFQQLSKGDEKANLEKFKPNKDLSTLKANESILIEDERNRDYNVKESWNALPLHQLCNVEIGDEKENGKWANIFFQLIDNENLKKFHKLKDIVVKYIEKLKSDRKHFDCDSLKLMGNYIVKYDKRYLRAKLTSILKADEEKYVYRFFLCDYSAFTTIDADDLKTNGDLLFESSKEIVEFTPFQAIHCTLAGINSEYFSKIVQVEQSYLYVYAVAENKLKTPLKGLQINSFSVLLFETEKENDFQNATMLNKKLIDLGVCEVDKETKHYLEFNLCVNPNSFDDFDDLSSEDKVNPNDSELETSDDCERDTSMKENEGYLPNGLNDLLEEFSINLTNSMKLDANQNIFENKALEIFKKQEILKLQKTQKTANKQPEIKKLEEIVDKSQDSPKKSETTNSLTPSLVGDCTKPLLPLHARFRIPLTTWYETDFIIYLLIHVPDIQQYYLNITEDTIMFSTIVNDEKYALVLNLLSTIDPHKVTHGIRGLNLAIRLAKTIYMSWPRLVKQTDKFPWIKYNMDAILHNEDNDTFPLRLFKKLDHSKQYRLDDDDSSSTDHESDDDEDFYFQNSNRADNIEDHYDPSEGFS